MSNETELFEVDAEKRFPGLDNISVTGNCFWTKVETIVLNKTVLATPEPGLVTGPSLRSQQKWLAWSLVFALLRITLVTGPTFPLRDCEDIRHEE